MAKKLSPVEHREVEYLRTRCLLILGFAVERSDEPFPSAADIRNVIEHTARSGNLRGMRTLRSDLLDMSRALSVEDQRVLAELPKAHAVEDPFSTEGTV